MKRLAILLLAFVMITGCATGGGGGAGGGDAPAQSPSGGSDSKMNAIDEELDEQPATSEKAPILANDEKGSGPQVGGKYKALAQAVRAGQTRAINDEASKILGADSNDPTALNTLALFYFRRGKLGAAKLLLAKAFEKNQNVAALYNNLGVINLAENEQDLAIMNFKKALRIDGDHAEALGNLGSQYAAGGDWVKAEAMLEKSYRQNRANPAIANNYAVVLRVNKNYDAARRIYEDLMKQDSKNVEALINYAILMIDYMDKPKDGLAAIYRIKFLEPEKKDIMNKANALEKKAKSEVK